jgi:hypothetical protein
MSINGIENNCSTPSSTSTSSTTSSIDSQVDHNDFNEQISKIKVTEDEDQVKKSNHKHILQQHFQQQQQMMENNSSEISSNCSSISINKFKKPINYDSLVGDRFVYNNNNQLVNLDRHSFHENQLLQATNDGNQKETNSLTDVHSYRVSVTNSDPVVVDNSISSTNTTKSDCSQIYGYNLANLVINKEKTSFSFDGTTKQQKYRNSQQTLIGAKFAATESFSDRDTYESDYSTTTPSNNKKVVYEVIV